MDCVQVVVTVKLMYKEAKKNPKGNTKTTTNAVLELDGPSANLLPHYQRCPWKKTKRYQHVTIC